MEEKADLEPGRMGEGDLKELRELVEFLKQSGVAEFDMERPELKVRLSFTPTTPAAALPAGLDLAQLARLMAAGQAPAAALPALAEVAAVHSAVASPQAVAAAAAVGESDEDAGLHIVKSPLVGTFYDAPSPGAEPFLKIGDKVSVGKVMCIVEAMKIMNEVESDGAGEIVKVYAKPGQPVEYGQKLFGIRP
jgi:acetyl-CoA carboxylase biotin carboxyl carrier protein